MTTSQSCFSLTQFPDSFVGRYNSGPGAMRYVIEGMTP
jgi:hypothetical protein